MDKLRIDVKVAPSSCCHEAIHVYAFVNGIEIPGALNVGEFLHSLEHSGRIPLFTCDGCGEFGCGGYYVDVIAEDKDCMIWQDFNYPNEDDEDKPDLPPCRFTWDNVLKCAEEMTSAVINAYNNHMDIRLVCGTSVDNSFFHEYSGCKTTWQDYLDAGLREELLYCNRSSRNSDEDDFGCLRCWIDKGADVHAKNEHGVSTMELALNMHNKAISDFFFKQSKIQAAKYIKQGRPIQQVIEQELENIERAENVRILFAVESGSRAWGFASPDSDYDVRFIYVRPRDYYLRLDKTRDVIERQADEILDINGWDLQKALRLVHESNPAIFEWLSSKVIYKQTDEFARTKEILLNGSFYSAKASYHHYLSMAKRHSEAYLSGDRVRLKKYFYGLRAILAARWIMNNGTLPPILFRDLMASQFEESLKPAVNKLLERKAQTSELGTGNRIDALDRYIMDSLDYLEEHAAEVPITKSPDWDRLNGLFLKYAAY